MGYDQPVLCVHALLSKSMSPKIAWPQTWLAYTRNRLKQFILGGLEVEKVGGVHLILRHTPKYTHRDLIAFFYRCLYLSPVNIPTKSVSVLLWLREWGCLSTVQSTSMSTVLGINHTCIYIYIHRYICMEVDVMMSCSNSWSHFVGSWIYFWIALSFTQAGTRIQSPPPLSTSFAYRDTSQPSVVRRSPFPTCCRPPGSWLSQKSVYK